MIMAIPTFLSILLLILLICPPIFASPLLSAGSGPLAPPPVDRSPLFDPLFLQKAFQGQIPGVDGRFVLDLAWWFHTKSIPCCERVLRHTPSRHLFNCTSLPEPTDSGSSQFLLRMITECIGGSQNVGECCTRKGIRSPECLGLCNMEHPALSVQAFETDRGSELMQHCADQMRVPREQFLWAMFDCLNPNFARVTQITQQLRAHEQRQKQRREEEQEGRGMAGMNGQ